MHHSRSPIRLARSGSALLIVLILTILLLVATLALWTANENQEGQMVVNLTRVQAEFLAKGAHQLALLKARLQAQPLYDASDYAVGKNPYYPHYVGYAHLDGSRGAAFSLNTAGALAPGPAFFTPREEDGGNVHDANIDASVAPEELAIMGGHLARYRADLADATIAGRGIPAPLPAMTWEGQSFQVDWLGQASIRIDEASPDVATGLPGDPYSGSFEVLDMRILGGKDNQIHSEEALLVLSRARVLTRVSGIDRDWEADLRRVYKVKRSLQ